MVEYDQSHWHKVTEKPEDCHRIVVIYIPQNEYATAMCGMYIERSDKVYPEFGQGIELTECKKWCYLEDFW